MVAAPFSGCFWFSPGLVLPPSVSVSRSPGHQEAFLHIAASAAAGAARRGGGENRPLFTHDRGGGGHGPDGLGGGADGAPDAAPTAGPAGGAGAAGHPQRP